MLKIIPSLRNAFRTRASVDRDGAVEASFGAQSFSGLGRTVVLTGGNNASVSYLLESYLDGEGTVEYLHSDATPPSGFEWGQCKTVVVVRYLPQAWVKALRRLHDSGGRIIYFMDDDLMDRAALHGLPEKFVRKIDRLAIRQRPVIESLCTEFWVASSFLANKYAHWSPKTLTPRPATRQLMQSNLVTICYHGTASHASEHKWLVQVIAKVQKQKVSSFEVFGDLTVNRMFRALPGVSVLHPMSWDNYLSYTSTTRRDIALAPLLPGPFNDGRGPTKFYDFVRMGAVGIYTDVLPYQGFIRDGVDGILLPNEPDLWANTMLELAADPHRRQRMALAARERALSIAWDRPDGGQS